MHRSVPVHTTMQRTKRWQHAEHFQASVKWQYRKDDNVSRKLYSSKHNNKQCYKNDGNVGSKLHSSKDTGKQHYINMINIVILTFKQQQLTGGTDLIYDNVQVKVSLTMPLRYSMIQKDGPSSCQTVGCGIPSFLLTLQVDLATLKTLLNSSHVLLWYTWSAGAFAFTQRAYLLKLVIPTNALPHWRLNVEMKTKHMLYSSCWLRFNELTNAKNLVQHSSHFAHNWHCCMALGEHSSSGIWKFRTSSFKCYVDHSHTMHNSGNIDIRNWVHLFWITLYIRQQTFITNQS